MGGRFCSPLCLQQRYLYIVGAFDCEAEAGYTWDDVNDLNKAQWQRDKDRNLDDVLADFHNTYHEVYRLISGLSEADLFENLYDGLIREPMWRLVKYNTYHHFHEHIVPVREWLAKST